MNEFAGKVAVVTGAGSGIGRALALRCAKEAMHVVIADVDEHALGELTGELRALGAQVLARQTDVSRLDAVAELADATFDGFGQVDLLFNNAGVLISGHCWDVAIDDWEWILRINLFGVLHGIKAFVPRMLAAGRDGHIVNTASLAGLLAAPLMGPYTVGKQAVVALAETLHYDLAAVGSRLKTSVLCPGPVATGIAHSGEHRSDAADQPVDPAQRELMAFLNAGIDSGMSPKNCADIVFDAIGAGRFWIFTHEDFRDAYRRRVDSVFDGVNPVYQMYTVDGPG